MFTAHRVRTILVVIVTILGIHFFGMVAVAKDNGAVPERFSPEQNRQIEQIVREYLLSHPEIIVEAMQKLDTQQQETDDNKRREAATRVKPVDGEDHILGNPNAAVKIIEFSDFECPFCKGFHSTLKQAMDEYGNDGKLAWVYRHFPIDQLHSKARKEAQAAECAGELGGNPAFWAFANRLFEVTPSNNGLDPALLPQIAEDTGLDRVKFETCLDGDERGGKFAAHIEEDEKDANAAGGDGTPYSIVIGPKGGIYPINGALSYDVFREMIETALKE